MQDHQPIPIRTKRLELISCTLEMAQALLQDRKKCEKLLGTYLPLTWPNENLMRYFDLYVQKLSNDSRWGSWGPWLILLQSSREIIGDIGFKGPPDDNGNVEIGYSILSQCRRRGYATEAVEALVRWAFLYGAKSILAKTETDNAPSVSLLEKLGFNPAGVDEDGLNKWKLKKDYLPV